jgi:dTMP kinase
VNSNQKRQSELAIWKEIASDKMSVSHDHWHIDRVLRFARQLQSIYGGDPDVITAAVILHDLGREDASLHGQDSIHKSIIRARKILNRLGLPQDKADQVITAIDEHDKPETRPSTLEGRILKDADFLGGFGAWGILRIGMWAGETSGGISQVLDRLEHRMPRRLTTLEFVESERLAEEEMLFANLFLSRLRQPPELPARPRRGKYIVLEGISGSGKDTQADRLQKRLEMSGCSVLIVHEPTDVYRELRDVWKAEHHKQLDDPAIMKYLLMADRYELIQNTVWPALEKGQVVISVRSFISTLVYQCDDSCDIAATAFAHRFVPQPDLLLLFDVDADVAWTRISSRKHKGIYETRDLLKKHRSLYRDICSCWFEPRLRIIDAAQPVDEVTEQTWKAIETHTH